MNTLGTLTNSLRRQGKLAEVEGVAQENLAMAKRLFPGGGPRLVGARELLGLVLKDQSKLDQAAAQLRQACEYGGKTLGEDSPQYGRCLGNLARVLEAQNKLNEAESLYRESLARLRRALGDTDTMVTGVAYDFAANLRRDGKHAEAERICRELIAAHLSVLLIFRKASCGWMRLGGCSRRVTGGVRPATEPIASPTTLPTPANNTALMATFSPRV